MPVKPPSTGFYLFASEYQENSKNKDENPEIRKAQLRADWNALSKEEKEIYHLSVTSVRIQNNSKIIAF